MKDWQELAKEFHKLAREYRGKSGGSAMSLEFPSDDTILVTFRTYSFMATDTRVLGPFRSGMDAFTAAKEHVDNMYHSVCPTYSQGLASGECSGEGYICETCKHKVPLKRKKREK